MKLKKVFLIFFISSIVLPLFSDFDMVTLLCCGFGMSATRWRGHHDVERKETYGSRY